MPTVLGIDPGSYVAGYGVVQASPRIEYIQCGVLKLPKASPLNARLALLIEDLDELLEEFHVDALAIERAYLGEHPQAAIVLSEVRGAIKGFALGRKLPIIECAPSSAKRAATGRGNATKPEVASQLMRRFQIETPPPRDATDALAIAVFGALEFTGRRPTRSAASRPTPRGKRRARAARGRGTTA